MRNQILISSALPPPPIFGEFKIWTKSEDEKRIFWSNPLHFVRIFKI